MIDGRGTYAREIDTPSVDLCRVDRRAEAETLRGAIEEARGDAGLQAELATALVHLGKLEQELGRPAEAERLLVESLAISERQHGALHVALVPVLNELSRLYLRQSDHARAEQALERLLQIARGRGERHPDVATALTGLALVKRALGDDASAERRFREALKIREIALAPHHMATVVTMEQLSETCATRGNLAEALALLQRALLTREAVLGSEHATVRALRSRIAALELRETTPEVALAAPIETKPTAIPAFGSRRRTRLYAFGGLAAASLVAALAWSRSSGASGSDTDAPSADERSVNAVDATSAGTLQLLARSAPPVKRAPDSATAAAPLPSLPAPRMLAALKVAPIATANVDSLLRATTTVGRQAYDRIGSSGGLRTTPLVDDASEQPPVLIGAAPVPSFPDVLRSQRTEGEFVVRFRVDERGRVDPSTMKVLKSDHELFTLAVRNVLPRFRFEPARSSAPESKPRSEWVDFRAEFTTKN